MKKFTLLLSLVLILGSGWLRGQNAPITTLGSASTMNTEETIFVTVDNFINVGSTNLTITYNPAIATVANIGHVLMNPAPVSNPPSLPQGGPGGFFQADISVPGQINVGWFTFPGVTLANGTWFFSIKFTKVSSGTTALTFQPSDGYSDGSFVPMNQTPFSNYYINGTLTFISDTDAPQTIAPVLTNLCPGTPVNVPVTVNNFNAVGKFDLRMTYNSAALSYASFTNTSGFPGLSVTNPTPGVLLVQGINTLPAGFSLVNGATFFTLNFNYIGGYSDLSWIDNGTSCAYYGRSSQNYPNLNDIPFANYYTNGSVNCVTQLPVWTTQPGALDVTVPCNNITALNNALALAPAATAACSMQPTIDLESDVITQGLCPGLYTRVRTWSAYDDCNNTAATFFTQTITVGITTPPVAPLAGASTVQCPSQALVPTPPAVNDQCGNTITPVLISTVNTPNPVTCNGTRVYTYRYTDCAQNQVDWVYTYTITLATPPVDPPDVSSTVQCLSQATPPQTPVVTDACGRNITPQLVNTSDLMDPSGCSGIRTYTYQYTDCANQSVLWTYTYNIQLVTPPQTPQPGGSTVQCLSAATPPAVPQATDFCGNPMQVQLLSVDDQPVTITCNGIRTYHYKFTDCASNEVFWTYTYTILHTTPPAQVGGPVPAQAVMECATNVQPPAQLPVVADICGNILNPTGPVTGGTYNGCEGTITYSYTYQDCAGLQFVWNYTYVIDRVTIPYEDGTPVTHTAQAECLASVVPPTQFPVVKDVCGNVLSPSPVVTGGTYNGCEGTITYSYNYTDCSGLIYTWVYTWTIDRVTPPVETGAPVPLSSVVNCPGLAVAPSVLPQVTDVCGQVIPAPQPQVGGTFVNCEGTITYTYRYMDCSGLYLDWIYTYDIQRSGLNPPAEAGGPVPNSSVVQCLSGAGTPQLPVVKDECGITLQAPVPVINTQIANCEGTRTYTYDYRDCKNQSFVWTYTYTIDRITAPVVSAQPGAVVVQCLAAAVPPTQVPTATGICGEIINGVLTGTVDNPATITCEGSRVYTYTYTDCDPSLTTTWTYTYTINRTTAPVVAAQPGFATVQCLTDAVAPAQVPTATGICGETITGVLTGTVDNPSTITCEGTRVYTYTYADCDPALTATWTFTYSINRTTAPVVSAQPGQATVECLTSAVAPLQIPTATGVCGETINGVLTGTVDNPSTLTCEGTRVYTYTYTDCDPSLTTTWTFTYTIDRLTAPIISASPGAAVVECLSAATPPAQVPTALGACGEVITGTLSSTLDNPATIDCEGTRVYTYIYTDCDQSLTASWTFTYTINRITAPVVSAAPGAATVQCISAATPPLQIPAATGVCGESIPGVLTSTVDNPSLFTCEGTRVYTYTYTDCDNTLSATWTFTYTIDRTTALVVSAQPGTASVQCLTAATVPSQVPTASGICGEIINGVLTSTIDNPATITCEGTRVYTYTYTDCDPSLTTTWTFTYTIDRLTAPLVSASPGAAVVECLQSAVPPVFVPTATGTCGESIQGVLTSTVDNPASFTCEGTRVYTYTYYDCDQTLSSTWTFTYTVNRTTAPVVSTPSGAASVECLAAAVPPALVPTATGACGETINGVLTNTLDIPASITCEGIRIYTYTYTDCDPTLFTTWTFTYTIDRVTPLFLPPSALTTVQCIADAVAPAQIPWGSGACGEIVTGTLTGVVDNPANLTCEGTRTYTYSYVDCDPSLSGTWTYTYQIDLTAPPVVPANGASSIPNVTQAVPPVTPSVTDACGNSVTAVLASMVDQPDPLVAAGTRTYTYSYTDCALNTTSWIYVYTVDPTMAPPIPADGASQVQCITSATLPVPPVYTDACNNNVTAVFQNMTDNPPTITCEGVRVYNFTYTDCYNQVFPWKYTYTINRTTAPVVAAQPGFATVECLSAAIPPVQVPTATGSCGEILQGVLTSTIDNPANLTCEGTRVYTYTYTDCDPTLTTTWTFTYTIDRITAPVVSAQPGFATVQCLSAAIAPTQVPAAAGICGEIITGVLTSTVDNPATLTCEGSRVYTFTYTDCDPTLTSTWTFTYTIDRTTAPVVSSQPGFVTVECLSAATPPAQVPTATGACGEILTGVLTGTVDNPATITCEGTRVYTYTYTDCDQTLSSTWTYTYTIDRATPPVVSAQPGFAAVECISAATPPAQVPTATGVCNEILQGVLTGMVDNPATITCEGTRVYTYTYTDCDQTLSSTWTFTYSIDRTTAPVVAAQPGFAPVECLSAAIPPAQVPTATGACGETLTGVLTSTVDNPATLTCEGTRVYTYTYTDCDPTLTSTWTFTYTIDRTTAPVVSAQPGSATVQCLSAAVAPTQVPTAAGICGEIITGVLTGTADNPATITCEGSRVYTYTYTDCDPTLTSTWTFTYTIDRTTAPVVSAQPGFATVECLTAAIPPAQVPTALGACGEILTGVLTGTVDNPATITCEGTRVYTYTYTDCDPTLTATWTYTYTISRTTAPVVAAQPGFATVQCLSDAIPPAQVPTATGACGEIVSGVLAGFVDNPATFTCEGTRVYTYTYTDCDQSLTSTWSFTYTIDRTTAPVVAAQPGFATVECLSAAIPPALVPTATGNCGETLTGVLTSTVDNPATLTCEGTRVFTYTYTDCDQTLTSTWTFTYTIDRTTTPVVAAQPGSATVECLSAAIPPAQVPTALGACGEVLTGVLTGTVDNPATLTCEGSRVYTYAYTDCDQSLTSTWTFTYTIDRTTAPVVSAQPGFATVECLSAATPPAQVPTALGACGEILTGVLTSTVDNPATIICEGTRVYTYTYTDCDPTLTSTWTFTYTINRTTAPVVSAQPGFATVECLSAATPPAQVPTATGACGEVLQGVLTGTVDNPATITCEGTRVYTYTYTDCDPTLTSTWTFTYTIDRTTAPVVAAQPGIATVQCLSAAIPPAQVPTATGICSEILQGVLTGTVDNPATITCEGTRVFTYTYTDCDPTLTTTWTYTYTIDLTTAPAVPVNGFSTIPNVNQAVIPTPPVVNDFCGNPLQPVLMGFVDIPNPILTNGTRTYTYAYTDCAQNTSLWNYVYTIDPTMAPPVPPNGSALVSCVANAVAPTPPVYVDGCSNNVIAVFQFMTDIPSTLVCEGTRTYHYTYTDCYNQVFPWTFTYTIDRTTAPVILATPGSGTVECLSAAVPPQNVPTATGVCGETINGILTSTVDNPASLTCEGSRVYTYTYTDCDPALSAIWTYTYTIDRITAPVVSAPAGFSTVQCIAAATQPVNVPTATGSCGEILTGVLTTTVDIPASLTCEGSRIYIFTYTDCDPTLTNTWTYTYTINRTTPPVVALLPGSATVECLSAALPPANIPTALGACGEVITGVLTSVVDLPATLVCEGSRVYTYAYADCDPSLLTTWTFTYLIDRLTIPVVAQPAGASTVECWLSATPPVMVPAAMGACGSVIQGVLTNTTDYPATIACEGSRVYTYTYTDCDPTLTTTWTYTYNIDRTVAPVIAVPAGTSSVECPTAAVPPSNIPVATGVCGEVIIGVLTSTVDNPATLTCEGSRIYTYSYIDCDPTLTTTWTYTYTINRVNPPAEIGNPVASGSIVTCYAQAGAPQVLPLVKDVCGNTLIPAGPVVGGTWNGCEGTVTYSYSYTDCSNLQFVWTYTYTIDLNILPVVPANGAQTVECLAYAVAPAVPVVTDHCGNTLTAQLVSMVDNPAQLSCEGTRTFTYSYTDCAQNTVFWSFVYTIDLATSPVVPANAGANVPVVAQAVPPVTPVVTDACGNSLTAVLISMVDQPDPILTTGMREYTYQYADCAGNISVWTFTYIVTPNIIPVFPADGGSSVNCVSEAVIPVPPVYIDQCNQIVTPVYNGVVTTPDPIVCEGTRSYAWTYTDCNNQVNVWTYTYTIDLVTPPAVPTDGAATVQCLVAAIAPAPPQVTDHCGRPVSPILQTVVNAPQPLTCEGTRTYTYAYKDCALNTSLWKFVYTIDRVIPPAPVGPAVPIASSVQCQSQALPPAQLPVVKDVCGATLQPTGPVTGGTWNGCEGTITYTFNYTDCSGLPYAWTYTYTVDMVTPPQVPAPGSATVMCLADAVPPVTPVVTDHCGSPVLPQLVGITDVPSPLICNGTRTYQYSYTDCAQNTLYWSFTYTIDLTQAPLVPANGSATVPVVSMAMPPVTPVIQDACGNTLTAQLISMTDQPDPLLVSGTRIYLYAYTDCASNSSTWSFTYTVDSSMLPQFPVDGAATVACISAAVPPNPPVFIDYCNNSVVPVLVGYADTPDPLLCEGTRIYTYQYTDCFNQTYLWHYSYTIDLSAPPVVPVAGSAVVQCLSNAVPPAIPFVTDACGNTLQAVLTGMVDAPDPILCEGTRTYTYTFTDCASNSSTWQFVYSIDLSTPPVVPANGSSTVECLTAAVAPVPPVVTDHCSNVLTPVLSGVTDSPDPLTCEGTRVYTYVYTDCAQNTVTWTYTYFIDRTLLPAEYGNPVPVSASVACEALATAPSLLPVITDACGNTLSPSLPVLGGTFNGCSGTITYTYTYTDCSNLAFAWTFTYAVGIAQPPAVPQDGTASVECLSSAIAPLPPVVTDQCGNPIQPVLYGVVNNPDPITCQGTRTYTYSYTDCAQNTSWWNFTYLIQRITPPSISSVAVPDQASVSCAADAVPPLQLPLVTDACGNTLTAGAPLIAGTFNGCSGSITYTYTFIDCAGLPIAWTFTYWVQDQMPPVVTCPGAQQKMAGQGLSYYTAAGVEFDPLSTLDNCGIAQVVNNLSSSSSLAGYNFPVGITQVVWTVYDHCGNSASCAFAVEVLPSSFAGCLDLKVFLQGPFDINTGLMWDSLRAKGFIPASEPYSTVPYNTDFTHTGGGGGETIAAPTAVLGVTGSNAIVDWVFIELRSASDSTVVEYTRSALLQRDGDVVDVDGFSPLCFSNLSAADYYVAIRHRNHLGVMTATPVTMNLVPVTLDFRTGQLPEYTFGTQLGNGIDYTGLAQKAVAPGIRALYAGNALTDNKLKYQGNGSDRNAILSQLLSHPLNVLYLYNFDFATGYYSGDTNLDGKVKYQGGGNDAAIMLSNVLNFLPGNTQSFDFLFQQLPQ